MTISSKTIPHKFRNKYLRNTNAATSGSSSILDSIDKSSIASDIKYLIEKAHEHSNMSVLELLSIDDDNYVYLKRLVDEKIKAGYADEAGSIAEEAIKKLKELFISSTEDDTAEGVITFLKGLLVGDGTKGIDKNGNANLLSLILGKFGITEQGVANLLSVISNKFESLNFVTGILGSGLTLKIDENGDSYIEIDRALFRKSATFVEIIIQSLKHVGGQIILTPASMHCIKVESYDTYYRCYFMSEDGDKTIFNEFVVGDMARSQTFNIKAGVSHNVSNGYYWRKVVGVGDDYIDLSKTDCDAGSTVPQPYDDIVQLGNESDVTRQAALVLSAFGNDAPYLKFYKGINSYSMTGKEIVNISRSEVSIIADKFKFSTGESVKDYIDGMLSTGWVAGTTYQANTTLSQNNILFKAKVDTAKSPCEINQDETGDYILDENGDYMFTAGPDGKPIINTTDWEIIMDNRNISEEARKYTDSQFKIASDEISSKVNKAEYNTDKNGIVTRLTSAESSIVQQAEDITARVTKTVYESGLQDLQISNEQYADAKAALAEANANATTEAAKKQLQNTINALDAAKANADDVYDKATADGKITASEQAAIEAANASAEAAKNLAIVTANAYADGVVDEEEARAIKDATDKANAAKTAAINAAATDATDKANAAQLVAKSYTDAQVALTAESIALKVSKEEVRSPGTWTEGKSYSFPVMVSCCNLLFQAKSTTTNPPCSVNQDENGGYIKDETGDYVYTGAADGKPIINTTDWQIVMDNTNIEDLAKSYSNSLFELTNDKISMKVSQADVDASTGKIVKSLEDTGIDIENKLVKLTADTFLIRDNSGNQMAVFELVDGKPRLKTQYINAESIVINYLQCMMNNILVAGINTQGNGEFIQYYKDTGRKSIMIDEGVIYRYTNDASNTLAWKINLDAAFLSNTIDSWQTIYMCPTDSSGDGVQTIMKLSGTTYKQFSAKTGTVNAGYNQMVAVGTTANDAAPSSATRISDGWYTFATVAFQTPMQSGTSKYTRILYRYSNGFSVETKQFEFISEEKN